MKPNQMKTALEVQFSHLEKDVERLKDRMDKGDSRDRENEKIITNIQLSLSGLKQSIETLFEHKKSTDANTRWVVIIILTAVIGAVLRVVLIN